MEAFAGLCSCEVLAVVTGVVMRDAGVRAREISLLELREQHHGHDGRAVAELVRPLRFGRALIELATVTRHTQAGAIAA
jgi:hypothetical protein